MPATINSNSTSLSYAEETTLQTLGGAPVWYPLEPNSYSNFGGDTKTTPREPISPTRQRAKGTVTDLDVKVSFSTDWTHDNMTRLLQGFLFASAREKAKTQPINGAQYPITGVAPGSFSAAAGLAAFPVSAIVKSSNFTYPANNTLTRVTATSAAQLTVVSHIGDSASEPLVAENPDATAKLEQVGFALSGDVKLYGPGSTHAGAAVVKPFLFSAATVDFTKLGLIAGEWIYLGDVADKLNDNSASEFNFVGNGNVRCQGYCRIASITPTILSFDIAVGCESWALGAGVDGSIGVGASGYVSMYFGTVIRNEPSPANIVRRSYTIQRYLGKGLNNLDNLEYVNGAVPNEVVLNIPSNNKLTAEMTFVGMDTQQQNAAALTGTYKAAISQEAINTSQDVYAQLLYLIDKTKSAQTPLFAYASSNKLTINNNTKADKAIGVVGAFEANVGMFDVNGSITCYFDDIKAMQAVRNNSDVGLVEVFANQDGAFILDIPLLTLGMGGLKVEKDKSIMADITSTGSMGEYGYTLLYNKFAYVPSCATAGYSY